MSCKKLVFENIDFYKLFHRILMVVISYHPTNNLNWFNLDIEAHTSRTWFRLYKCHMNAQMVEEKEGEVE